MNELSEISVLVKEYVSPETVWLVPCLYHQALHPHR